MEGFFNHVHHIGYVIFRSVGIAIVDSHIGFTLQLGSSNEDLSVHLYFPNGADIDLFILLMVKRWILVAKAQDRKWMMWLNFDMWNMAEEGG